MNKWVPAIAIGALGLALPASTSLYGTVSVGQVAALPPTDTASIGLENRAVLDRYCVTCHNQRLKTAGLMLDALNVQRVSDNADAWESVLRKLQTRAMPPLGRPRPDHASYESLSRWLEGELDRAALDNPNPGRPTLHRLNRAEYANAIRDVIGLEIDGAALLPPDNAGYGFDNIGDVLSLSPALTERYLAAAAHISRAALGRVSGSPATEMFSLPNDLDQRGRVSDDLPFGSRGGLAVRHYFPRDGEYLFKVQLQEKSNGIPGLTGEPNQLDLRLDGVKVGSATVGGRKPEPEGAAPKPKSEATPTALERNPMPKAERDFEFRRSVKAGAHLVQAFFVQQTSALLEDLIEPDLRSRDFANDLSGEPAIFGLSVTGPYDRAVSNDSPTRRRILICRPTTADEERCAARIISALARRAYRRPVAGTDVRDLLGLYRDGARTGGFEAGIEVALRGILVSPQFLFRFETEPANTVPGAAHRITEIELASRLSFFLWSSVPDEELLGVTEGRQLRHPTVLPQQIRRMLHDPRSKALITNFAGQWLHVRNVPGLRPNPELFFAFDDNLREAFRRETALFIESILREDRSVFDLLDADYTFLNERLARHYGIPGVYGEQFRRVSLPTNSVRRGLLGQGSILTVTSHANSTSPVLRGKWILENLLGTPPPPPPPDVPELQERDERGKVLPMRERMAQHRKNPACAGCHSQMDQLGFALENFDAIGRWRTHDESGLPIDASGALPDGERFDGPAGLRRQLMNRSDLFMVTFIEKLLTYALGRGLEHFDAPAVRRIKSESARANYRISSVITAVVNSTPFQMKKAARSEALPVKTAARP